MIVDAHFDQVSSNCTAEVTKVKVGLYAFIIFLFFMSQFYEIYSAKQWAQLYFSHRVNVLVSDSKK